MSKKDLSKKGQVVISYKNIDLSSSIGVLNFSKEMTIHKLCNNTYNIDYVSCGEWVVLEKLELEEVKDFLKKDFNLDEKKIEEILDESTFISV